MGRFVWRLKVGAWRIWYRQIFSPGTNSVGPK